MYTDGVIETEGLAGDQLGLKSLRRIVRYTPEDDKVFSRIIDRVDAFRAGREQSDDVTLLEYTCPPDGDLATLNSASPFAKPSGVLGTDWYLRLSFDVTAMRTFDPRPVVTQILMDIQRVFELRRRLYMVISELFAAVLEHGVLGLDPVEKADPSLHLDYQRKLAARLDELETGGIVMHVEHSPCAAGGRLKIAMSIGAEGVSSNKHTRCNFGELQHLRNLCERVELDSSGTGISVECHWQYIDD